ncbi:hypothetical protein ASPCAL14445 [Aspergillus calidoustus]|uniref:Uncharacterized protein n=1 Tax=Aspergillus calidoustus TaxID=454130 RepID=A0A0U5GKK4_ASPCI|nr:hypothetical protein ASPCAL14445 [Aspergillus calidoustus]
MEWPWPQKTDRFHPIATAAANNNETEVFAILRVAPGTEKQELSDIALKYGAKHGHISLVKTLLRRTNARVCPETAAPELRQLHAEHTGFFGSPVTALHLAVKNKHYETVRVLLNSRRYLPFVSWYPRAGYWMSAIFVAVENGDLEMVRLMLDNGVDVNYAFRCLDCQRRAFKLLADCKHCGWMEWQSMKTVREREPMNSFIRGKTALDVAAERGQAQIAELLLACGAKREACVKFSPLMAAAEHGHAAVIRALLKADRGFDVDELLVEEIYPLSLAVEHNHRETVETLLAAGARVANGMVNPTGVLFKATIREDLSLTQLLLKHAPDGFHPEVMDRALAEAAKTGNAPLFNTLMDYALDKVKEPIDYSSPLVQAAQSGHANMVQRMIVTWTVTGSVRSFQIRHAICLAGRYGHDDVIHRLLDWDESAENRPMYLLSALYGAIYGGRLSTVQKLATLGADLHGILPLRQTTTGIEYPHTLLHYELRHTLHAAAYYNRPDIVQYLLKQGAEVNQRGPLSYTALHHASKHGHTEVVKVLLDHGAAVNLRDESWGWTPLHAAASQGSSHVIELLLEHGADVGMLAGENGARTPLYEAAYGGNQRAFEILAEAGAEDSAELRKLLRIAISEKENW